MDYWYTHPPECEWCRSDYDVYRKADVMQHKARHGTFNLCSDCADRNAQNERFMAASRVGWFPNL